MKILIALVLALILFAVISTQITLFVIQPLGALPTGKTLVILRMNNTKFIDSADAICDREMGGVSLLCRGVVMSAFAKNAKILIRLPYSELLYTTSTGGKKYEK